MGRRKPTPETKVLEAEDPAATAPAAPTRAAMAQEGQSGPSTAQAWREAAAKERGRLAVPLRLPSGMTVTAVRPEIEMWFGTGRLPQTLSADIVRVFGRPDEIEAAFEEMGEARAADVMMFMRRCVEETVQNPVITPRVNGVHFATRVRMEGVPLENVEPDPKTGLPLVRPLRDNEIAPEEVPLRDFAFIVQWVTEGSPEVPVRMKGGTVPHSAVRKFRAGGARTTARPRKARRKVRQTAK
jgi:hypothetical protein